MFGKFEIKKHVELSPAPRASNFQTPGMQKNSPNIMKTDSMIHVPVIAEWKNVDSFDYVPISYIPQNSAQNLSVSRLDFDDKKIINIKSILSTPSLRNGDQHAFSNLSSPS